MNRILLSTVLAAMVVAAVSAAKVEASYVTLSEANVVVADAVYSSPGTNLAGAVDGKVSDGVPGEASFDDSVHFVFAGVDNQAIIQAWNSPQTLGAVQAYVCHGGLADADRLVSSVEFLIKTEGSADWNFSIVVPTVDTNDIGGFDLTQATGNWANVIEVGYAFTAGSGQGPRIAEVRALTLVPEPATMYLAATGLLGLLAYAWRKRR